MRALSKLSKGNSAASKDTSTRASAQQPRHQVQHPVTHACNHNDGDHRSSTGSVQLAASTSSQAEAGDINRQLHKAEAAATHSIKPLHCFLATHSPGLYARLLSIMGNSNQFRKLRNAMVDQLHHADLTAHALQCIWDEKVEAAYATAKRRCLDMVASRPEHINRAVATLFTRDQALSLRAFRNVARAEFTALERMKNDRLRNDNVGPTAGAPAATAYYSAAEFPDYEHPRQAGAHERASRTAARDSLDAHAHENDTARAGRVRPPAAAAPVAAAPAAAAAGAAAAGAAAGYPDYERPRCGYKLAYYEGGWFLPKCAVAARLLGTGAEVAIPAERHAPSDGIVLQVPVGYVKVKDRNVR
eukprot:TRINITY_DN3669_c0_g1_i1.p1 TRINITY_DN3669_c0_g1~~TRINITY_DN3669_c0_g1_i1.p1  ORF type:complete len:359 (-),score=53.89 TRINITY_DN3669_c0_g1_i1:196-1272(-)